MTPKNSNQDSINAPSQAVAVLEFDLSGQQLAPPELGKTTTPVTVLPALAFDLAQVQGCLEQANGAPEGGNASE